MSGHLAYGGINDVQPMVGGKDEVGESVTGVDCAVCPCEINDKPEPV